MAQVSVKVNGRSYKIACGDGEEEHLRELARYVDKQVLELAEQVGQVGDTRLLLLASLLVADQLWEVLERLDEFEAGGTPGDGDPAEGAEKAADWLKGAADRLEQVAARLEGS